MRETLGWEFYSIDADGSLGEFLRTMESKQQKNFRAKLSNVDQTSKNDGDADTGDRGKQKRRTIGRRN